MKIFPLMLLISGMSPNNIIEIQGSIVASTGKSALQLSLQASCEVELLLFLHSNQMFIGSRFENEAISLTDGKNNGKIKSVKYGTEVEISLILAQMFLKKDTCVTFYIFIIFYMKVQHLISLSKWNWLPILVWSCLQRRSFLCVQILSCWDSSYLYLLLFVAFIRVCSVRSLPRMAHSHSKCSTNSCNLALLLF